jgi:hypothetical protein
MQFGHYRAQEGCFTSSAPAWDVQNNAINFWTEMVHFAPELSRFALRLLHTPANSVPSERSFSTRNLVQDVKRNSLSPDVADRLCYIHIIQRMLDRQPSEPRGWYGLSDEDFVG